MKGSSEVVCIVLRRLRWAETGEGRRKGATGELQELGGGEGRGWRGQKQDGAQGGTESEGSKRCEAQRIWQSAMSRAKCLRLGEEEEEEASVLSAGFDPILLTAILSILVVPH